MNTLVLLLMSAVPGADPYPVIQSQPAPVYQTQSGSINYDSGDSGWFSRFRGGEGLFPRLRSFFNRGRVPDAVQPNSYPSSVSGTTPEGRLVPTPIMTAPVTAGPSINRGTTPYQTTPPIVNTPAQPLPIGPGR
jgi:hypothetical protein